MTPEDAAAVMGAVPVPLVLVGTDERVVAANAAAEALFGDRSMAGRHHTSFLRQPAVLDCVAAALREGREASAQVSIRDGARDAVFLAKAAPFSAGGLAGAMVSFDDFTMVEEAAQMRRDFVANVSHELRTPVTALLGFIETLRGPARDDPEARERFLGIMEAEAGRMGRLIRDLLSLSRVEAEARMRPAGTVDLAGIVASAAASLERLAAERGTALSVEGAGGALRIPGDADQLLQVLNNLVENAVKYGGPNVSVSLAELDGDPARGGMAARLDVRDDGDGIDPLHLPRLTERFYRIDGHRSREMGGTGLGLAIVKHIVGRHRGRLEISSERGKGAAFTVFLPGE